jgi:hypothetical protein
MTTGIKPEAMLALKEQTRFYISTPEKAAEALLFIRQLEQFTEEVKVSVKARAVEQMDRENKDLITYSVTDPETGEVREWEMRRAYGGITKEYRPGNVLKALGEKALPYLTVKKGDLEKYLKRATAKGELTMSDMEVAVSDPIEKIRKGAGVMLKEIKAKV